MPQTDAPVGRTLSTRYQRPNAYFANHPDAMPYLINRVYHLFSWGRPYAIARRWNNTTGDFVLTAGLRLRREPTVTLRESSESWPSIQVISDSSSLSNDIGFYADAPYGWTEAEMLQSHNAGYGLPTGSVIVRINGGHPDSGPSDEDSLRISRYVDDRKVIRETVVKFDSKPLWDAWSEREEMMPECERGERPCREYVDYNGFRVACSMPAPRDASGLCPAWQSHDPYLMNCWPEEKS